MTDASSVSGDAQGHRIAGGPGAVVLGCRELGPTLAFFRERLGFRLLRIGPADDPRSALLEARGLRVLLERGADDARARLQFEEEGLTVAEELRAPNGTTVRRLPPRALAVPAPLPELVVARFEEADWIDGRAGMRYRDLIPGRLGGHLIASHIHVAEGGPVPDDVHFHAVRFQLIYCVSGWVRLVYEDQGEAFVLAARDAVLQPPRIRHRVLECSDDLEVVELACPAEHDTWLDHELELPTSKARPEREFDGQCFVRHVAERSEWLPMERSECLSMDRSECLPMDRSDGETPDPGLRMRTLGLGPATGGRLEAFEVDLGPGRTLAAPPDALLFAFLLEGRLEWDSGGLRPRDSVLLPPREPRPLVADDDGARVLVIRIPLGES